MKPRKLSIAIAAILCTGSLCMADSNQKSQQPPKVPITLVKLNRGTSASRPKAPDRQVITCAYDDETLHLSFVIPEGTATLSVTDETLLTATYEIDTTPLEVSIYVGELFGTVSISMETQSGKSYSGELY